MAKNLKALDPARIGIKSFSNLAEVNKNSDAGLSWTPLGAANAAIRVGPKTPVMCFNNTGAVVFVSFGDQIMAAPSAPANGMPVPANSFVVYNSGDQTWVRASSANCFVYSADPEV